MTTIEYSLEFICKRIASIDFEKASKPLIVGVSGPQGSGKSYLADKLPTNLKDKFPSLNIIQFLMDDLYFTRYHQQKITEEAIRTENKLLQGRGLPGTHDLLLILRVFEQLIGNYSDKSHWKPVEIPVYDKSAYNGLGERADKSQWQIVDIPADVIIFEGWFNGFLSLDPDQLRVAYFTSKIDGILQMNPYYHIEEINRALKEYRKIWKYFDDFIILHTNSIENVYTWRLQQEQNLIEQKGTGMTENEVKQFVDRYMPMYVLYYERLCESGLPNCPTLILSIDLTRKVICTRQV